MVHSGVGYYMPPKNVSIDSLEAALATLLPDLSEFRSRARQVQAEFGALGGANVAADAIEHTAKMATQQEPKKGQAVRALVERIRQEGKNLGRGILKVDGFVNHQLDPQLTMEMGHSFARRFAAAGVTGVTKIITAEVSGIAPALTTGIVLDVPIIYARKTRPITMPSGFFSAHAPSHTKGGGWWTRTTSPEIPAPKRSCAG